MMKDERVDLLANSTVAHTAHTSMKLAERIV
jgi:hypothetical protein